MPAAAFGRRCPATWRIGFRRCRSTPTFQSQRPHDEAEELLPWYATGQLDAAERARVERHLYACAECREQLCVERRLISEFQTISPQVEVGLGPASRGRSRRRRSSLRRGRPALAELWSILSRPAVATLAVAQLAFVIVAGKHAGIAEPAGLSRAGLDARTRLGQRHRHVPRRSRHRPRCARP